MTEKREIEIKLRTSSAESSADRLNKKVKGVGSSADGAASSFSNLTKVAAAVGTALATAQIQKYADAWTNANNRIRAATTTQQGFVTAQQGIIAIAQEAGIELSSVADGYSRLAQNTSELGLSQERILDITQKVTLAIKAGGATAQEASSIIVQLGQGLGAGALQGDELKSIMEASIPITKALAKEFGVTTGELKTLGSEGKITADRVVSALEDMDAKALTFTKDISGGFTEVANALTVYIGGVDESLGVTNTLVGSMSSLAQNIDVVFDGVTVLATLISARYVGSLTSAITSQVLLAAASLKSTTQMNALGQTVSRTTFAMNTSAIAARGLSTAMAFIGGPVGLAITAAAALYTFSQRSDEAGESAEVSAGKVDKLRDSFKSLSDNVRLTELDKTTKEMKALLDEQVKLSNVINSFDDLSGDPLAHIEFNEAKERIAEINLELDALSRKQEALTPEIDESGFTTSISDGQEVGASTSSTTSTDSGDNEAYNSLVSRLKLETEAIQAEEALRRSFAEGVITQNQLDAQQSLLDLAFNYEARRVAIEENEKLNAEQKAALLLELSNQEVEAAKLVQQRLTEAANEGADDRINIAQNESSQLKSMLIDTAVSAFNLTQSANSEMTKEEKKQAKQTIAIQTAAAIARAYGENNFYVASGMAVFLAAMQLQQLNNVDTASSSSATTTTASSSTLSTATPTTENQNITRTINITGLEGFGSDDMIPVTKAQFISYLSSDEDVNVAVNAGQTNASRIGAI